MEQYLFSCHGLCICNVQRPCYLLRSLPGFDRNRPPACLHTTENLNWLECRTQWTTQMSSLLAFKLWYDMLAMHSQQLHVIFFFPSFCCFFFTILPALPTSAVIWTFQVQHLSHFNPFLLAVTELKYHCSFQLILRGVASEGSVPECPYFFRNWIPRKRIIV